MSQHRHPAPAGATPIACSLDEGGARTRMARWQALADLALLDHARMPDGARQRYRDDRDVEQELEALVELEGRCCPFLSFELVRVGGALELQVRGPAEAGLILDAFASGGRPDRA